MATRAEREKSIQVRREAHQEKVALAHRLHYQGKSLTIIREESGLSDYHLRIAGIIQTRDQGKHRYRIDPDSLPPGINVKHRKLDKLRIARRLMKNG